MGGSQLVLLDYIVNLSIFSLLVSTPLVTLGKPQAVQLNLINIREIIENTLELLPPQALMNNIQFKLTFEESQFVITGERNQ